MTVLHLDVGRDLPVAPSVAWRLLAGHRVEATPTGCRVVFEVPTIAAPYAAVCRLALRRIAREVANPER